MLFKITNGNGRFHDDTAREDLLSYILSENKTGIGFFGAVNAGISNAAAEMQVVAERFGKDKKIRIRHLIGSFEPEEISDIRDVREIAEATSQFFGEKYQVVYAVHDDTEHTHFHLAFNPVSFIDGSKYRGNREEHYKLKNYLKEVCCQYGIKKVQYVSSKKLSFTED